jgi:hypothetical protein
MRISPLILASTLVVIMTLDAAAKPKGMGGGGFGGMGMGRGMGLGGERGFSSSVRAVRPWQNENHPAYWAPGHVKKRNGATSARMYAPSRANRETYLPPGQRFR